MVERKRVETFEDLLDWQKGIELVKQIYLLTRDGALSKDWGLRDQLQRAAVSIPANIAEGFERGSSREYVHFLYIAKGSAGEMRSLLRVALEIGYLDQPRYSQLQAQAAEISRFIANHIKSLFPLFHLSPLPGLASSCAIVWPRIQALSSSGTKVQCVRKASRAWR